METLCSMQYNLIYVNSTRHKALQSKRTAQLYSQQHNPTHVLHNVAHQKIKTETRLLSWNFNLSTSILIGVTHYIISPPNI